MDKKEHENYRSIVRGVGADIVNNKIYLNSRSAMKFTYKGNDRNLHQVYVDPMVSSAVVNALVPKSGVLYRGGHGGGKTSLVEKVSTMLTSIPEEEIERAEIAGNDDANVNTLLASLDVGKLMAKGEENIKWRKFVESKVKIIDELNRFPPNVQNALYKILNTGKAEFMDQLYTVEDFILYATENPNDPGTYPLSRPFLDRFSFCVPVPQLPSVQDEHALAGRKDDKLDKIAVKGLMKWEDLTKLRRAISEDVKLSPEALFFTEYLTQALTTCERADFSDKGQNEIPVGQRCKGCGFDTEKSYCKYTMAGISGRAFLDFQRWAKAYSWFLNAFEDPDNMQVQLETIEAIAPYLIYHRITPNEEVLNRDPHFGRKLEFAVALINEIKSGYLNVQSALKEIPKVLKGDIKPEEAEVSKIQKDLVVKYHFKPLVEEAGSTVFRGIYNMIEKGMPADEARKAAARIELETSLKPQAKRYLIGKLSDKARR